MGAHSAGQASDHGPSSARGMQEAAVEVHVCQRSTQQTAVVEFTFDSRAAGPGCYVVG